MNPEAKALVERRTVDLCNGGPLNFAELLAMILPEVQEIDRTVTGAAVLRAIDHAYLEEATKRLRAAPPTGDPR